jgi:hypothetical protein
VISHQVVLPGVVAIPVGCGQYPCGSHLHPQIKRNPPTHGDLIHESGSVRFAQSGPPVLRRQSRHSLTVQLVRGIHDVAGVLPYRPTRLPTAGPLQEAVDAADRTPPPGSAGRRRIASPQWTVVAPMGAARGRLRTRRGRTLSMTPVAWRARHRRVPAAIQRGSAPRPTRPGSF